MYIVTKNSCVLSLLYSTSTLIPCKGTNFKQGSQIKLYISEPFSAYGIKNYTACLRKHTADYIILSFKSVKPERMTYILLYYLTEKPASQCFKLTCMWRTDYPVFSNLSEIRFPYSGMSADSSPIYIPRGVSRKQIKYIRTIPPLDQTQK